MPALSNVVSIEKRGKEEEEYNTQSASQSPLKGITKEGGSKNGRMEVGEK